MSEEESKQKGGGHRLRRWLVPLLVVVAAVALFFGARHPAVRDAIVAVLDFCKGLGAFWAIVVITVAYVIACVFMFPGSVLTVGSGFIFSAMTGSILWGTVAGTAVVEVASTLGACAAFLVGRRFARGWVRSKLEGRPKFQAIDRAVGEHGLKIVFLTRLSPVFPFVLQNYAYGLTDVSFWSYAGASFVGMVPFTAVFVYFGAAAQSLTQVAAGEATGRTTQLVITGIGVVMAIVVVTVVTRVARRALERAAQEAGAEELVEEESS